MSVQMQAAEEAASQAEEMLENEQIEKRGLEEQLSEITVSLRYLGMLRVSLRSLRVLTKVTGNVTSVIKITESVNSVTEITENVTGVIEITESVNFVDTLRVHRHARRKSFRRRSSSTCRLPR